MKPAIIIDIDGTLSDPSNRRHFVEGDEKDWKSFNNAMGSDAVNEWCRLIISRFEEDHRIILVSGRSDEYRDITQKWLINNNIGYDALYMRKQGDYRKDSIVKQEIYNNNIKGFYNILFCIDDRQQVVDLWRSLGLVCLQCDKGDF